MRLLLVSLFALGCAGSPIGGKYGLGNNAAGYAAEARVRQERHSQLAAHRAMFNHYCMTPEERTTAQMQWCMMRQHDLDREEDQTERQEDRDAQKERDFQAWRQQGLDSMAQTLSAPSPPRTTTSCTSQVNGSFVYTNCN